MPSGLTSGRKIHCLGNAVTGSLQRTEEAVRRMGAALDRLEAAAATRVAAGDLLLAGQLRDAHDDYAHLQDTTRVVAARLDVTIDRLRVLLEE
jgi:hypothetical protein